MALRHADLEDDCPVCEGGGGAYVGGKRVGPCVRCHGEGVVPSAEGEVLLDFILRHAPRRMKELGLLDV